MCSAYLTMPNRILIVDDDVDLLMLLERRLQKEGYEVETAASLPEAEEMLEQFLPHLVLLDINVNGEDGRKLSWQLKVQSTPVKVILMSGYDISRSRAVLFGADDMLVKPLYFEYVLQRIGLHLQMLGNDIAARKAPPNH
jgi:DNA-binding response OmpR family regulator